MDFIDTERHMKRCLAVHLVDIKENAMLKHYTKIIKDVYTVVDASTRMVCGVTSEFPIGVHLHQWSPLPINSGLYKMEFYGVCSKIMWY